jgi:hypothetical protein
VAVLANFLAILVELVAPALADAVGKDGDSAVRRIDVDGIAALVLASAQRLDIAIPVLRHQIMAQALELVVIRQLLKAIDEGISGHRGAPSFGDFSENRRCFASLSVLGVTLPRTHNP